VAQSARAPLPDALVSAPLRGHTVAVFALQEGRVSEETLRAAGWEPADRRLPWGVARGWRDPASGRVVAQDTALRMLRKDTAALWDAHVATHQAPDGVALRARAVELGWSETELAVVWPHGTSYLYALEVSGAEIVVVKRSPGAPWEPGERLVYHRGEHDATREAATALTTATRGVLTRCMCTGTEGHRPGCADADQPWGPPYLIPRTRQETRYRREGEGWRREVVTVSAGVERVEAAVSDEEQERVLVLDTETTGLFRKGFVPRVIELAAALVELPSGRVVARWASLVDPETPVPPEASRANGIYAADLVGAPRWADLWPRVRERVALSGAVAVVAHCADFDRRVIEADCARIGVAPPSWPWACSRDLARVELPGRKSYSLQALRASEGLTVDGTAHRASGDVRVTVALLLHMLRGRRWSQVVARPQAALGGV